MATFLVTSNNQEDFVVYNQPEILEALQFAEEALGHTPVNIEKFAYSKHGRPDDYPELVLN